MGTFSIWHIVIFAVLALLLFGGRGKVSDLMGDVAKGVKSFKKGMADDDDDDKPRSIPDRRDEAVNKDKDSNNVR